MPENARRDVCERFAELLVAIVRSASREERSNALDEYHVEAGNASRVRAAVTLALDAALPAMIDKLTEQVLIALGH